MSKLSFQIQDFSRGDAPKSMIKATWPRAIKVLQDGIDKSLLNEMADHGLQLVVLRQTHKEDGDPGEMGLRVTQLCQLAEKLRFLQIRGVEVALEFPYNEELQTSAAGIAQLAAISIVGGQRILDDGWSLVMGIFSEGNPSDLQWWDEFHPALSWARHKWVGQLVDHGRVYLGLHEYSTPAVGGPFDSWHEGRYRRVWSILPDDCRIPILIVEGGIDGGIDGRKETGWRGYKNASEYADWCRIRSKEFDKDAYVHHVFDFLCGGNQQWESFDIQDEVDLRPVYNPGVQSPRWVPQGLILPPPQGVVVPTIGEGFKKLIPYLGQPVEAEVYHFAGTTDEASLAVFENGSAHWDKAANVVVAIQKDTKSVFVDWGIGPQRVIKTLGV